jgi:hypothetical protein
LVNSPLIKKCLVSNSTNIIYDFLTKGNILRKRKTAAGVAAAFFLGFRWELWLSALANLI